MNPIRQEQLLNWLRSVLNDSTIQRLQPASSDASFRSYHRIDSRGSSLVVMDAPPEHEDIRPWLSINQRLRAANLNAPEVMAANPEHGFVLMADLGHTPYLDVLDAGSRDQLYGDALDALLRMQTVADASGLPEYDAQRLRQELDLFPDWFLRRHLGVEPDAAALALIERCFARLIESALEQPQVFVHRDYHSRNLMR
ncbi:MAG: aminoglycoside phosphotransferase family protein, partial [Lysobacterales bacterium]